MVWHHKRILFLSNVILGKYDIIHFWYHYPFVVSISICHDFPFVHSLSISNQIMKLLWFSHTVHPEDREQDWTHHTFSFYSFQERRGNRVRKAKDDGTSLVVQWLRLCASNAGGAGLIPGQGSRIPYAVQCSPKINTRKLNLFFPHRQPAFKIDIPHACLPFTKESVKAQRGQMRFPGSLSDRIKLLTKSVLDL